MSATHLVRHCVLSVIIGVLLPLTSVVPLHAETLGLGGTGSALGTLRMLGEAFAKLSPEITIIVPRSLGSTGGIRAVQAGALDLAASARPLNEDEKKAGLVEMAYGKTPFIVVTSHPTYRENMTSADVVAIFSQKRTVWPDGSRIRLVLRPESDSDTDFLKANFPGIGPGLMATINLQTIPVATTDQDNLDTAEKLPGSFAVTSLNIVLSENRRKVTALPLDGFKPTLANLESGAYKYSKVLYFIAAAKPNQPARDFLAFVASPEGRRILRATGNLPLPLPR